MTRVDDYANAGAVRLQTSVAAVLSLVFGLLTWFVLPFIGALVAVICGHAARREIRLSGGRVDGGGMALAGLVLGWLNLLMWLFLALLFFGVIGLASGAFGLGHWMEQFHEGFYGCTMRV